jgi:hypothetical protein
MPVVSLARHARPGVVTANAGFSPARDEQGAGDPQLVARHAHNAFAT